MSSFMHSESRYSIYVSHAGALFFIRERTRAAPGLEAEPICTQFQKENFLPSRRLKPVHLICIESPYLIQMSRKYIRNYDVDLLKMSSKHVEEFNKRIRILCIKLEIN